MENQKSETAVASHERSQLPGNDVVIWRLGSLVTGDCSLAL